METAINKPAFTQLLNLAAEKIGAEALACSDDFFAGMENLVKPGRGVFIEGKYTERGKWMDGWESRRKRTPGHDWCVVKLGVSGVIRGFNVDTNHFLGNHPPHCSIEACNSPEGDWERAEWIEVLARSPLNPGSEHYFEIEDERQWTHVKLHIYPDGGVARLKVFGEVQKNWSGTSATDLVDLAAARNGAKSIICNDMFFSHMDNLLMPDRGVNMGDGWETKRNRTPNNRDWVIIRLARKGVVKKINVDTCHFKGNYPDSCSIEGAITTDENLETATWKTILPQQKLEADHEHFFTDEIISTEPFSHVRLNIFPDGGVSRLRLWGHINPAEIMRWEFNQLPETAAATALKRCCGASKWVDGMVAARPFRDQSELLAAADRIWASCEAADGLEAFSHHPKIGDRASLEKKFASTAKWAGNEQGGMAQADADTIAKLAQGNADYEAKFGFIFIVCATGKSAAEMLALLENRLSNDRETELPIAMAEQHKITLIRLKKLLA